jgi:hypothetical protein
MADLADLRRVVGVYREIDDQLKALNTQVYNLRERRQITELEIIDIIRQPAYAEHHKIQIAHDNSILKIKRPQEWSAPWSLSKRDLQALLEQYFMTPGPHNAVKCMEFIVLQQTNKLKQNKFSIERVITE